MTFDTITCSWVILQRRVAAVRMVGGVSLHEVMEGAEVPTGWILDNVTAYYVPPDFVTLNTVQ